MRYPLVAQTSDQEWPAPTALTQTRSRLAFRMTSTISPMLSGKYCRAGLMLLLPAPFTQVPSAVATPIRLCFYSKKIAARPRHSIESLQFICNLPALCFHFRIKINRRRSSGSGAAPLDLHLGQHAGFTRSKESIPKLTLRPPLRLARARQFFWRLLAGAARHQKAHTDAPRRRLLLRASPSISLPKRAKGPASPRRSAGRRARPNGSPARSWKRFWKGSGPSWLRRDLVALVDCGG
jgi:hypothetical protein